MSIFSGGWVMYTIDLPSVHHDGIVVVYYPPPLEYGHLSIVVYPLPQKILTHLNCGTLPPSPSPREWVHGHMYIVVYYPLSHLRRLYYCGDYAVYQEVSVSFVLWARLCRKGLKRAVIKNWKYAFKLQPNVYSPWIFLKSNTKELKANN